MAIDMSEVSRMLGERKSTGSSQNSNQMAFYNLPSGTKPVTLRILPPLPHEKMIGRKVGKHFNIPQSTPEDDSWMYCFRATYNLECPMCDMVKEYADLMDVEEYVCDQYNNTHFYLNALVLADEDYEIKNKDRPLIKNEVRVVRLSPTVFYWILGCIQSPDIGDITDPENGCSMTLEREKINGKFKYSYARKSTPIAPDKESIDKILNSMYDLHKVWKLPDDTYVKLAREYTNKSRDMLENKLVSLKQVPTPTASTSYKSQEAVPVTSRQTSSVPQSAPAPQATTSAPPVSSKPAPAGSPSCFADVSVFVEDDKRKDSEQGKKCYTCIHDYQCGVEIAKKNKGA